jgi:hypothetical protein
MTKTLLVLMLASAMVAANAAPPRFDGAGSLQPPDPKSADGRFALKADLTPAAAVSLSGRFTLQAALRPDAKSIAAVCGTDELFRNGFE